ncbi:hypothetical protein GCM10011297_07310 [Bacterioplanes sanyensis]|nr:hypothetical protein GCM10011297_07310 [Bacterioplanes sanyensis]
MCSAQHAFRRYGICLAPFDIHRLKRRVDFKECADEIDCLVVIWNRFFSYDLGRTAIGVGMGVVYEYRVAGDGIGAGIFYAGGLCIIRKRYVTQ